MRYYGSSTDLEGKATAGRLVVIYHLREDLRLGDTRSRYQEGRTFHLVHAFYYLLQLDFIQGQTHTTAICKRPHQEPLEYYLSRFFHLSEGTLSTARIDQL